MKNEKAKEIPEGYEMYEGKLMKVINGERTGWWRFHSHYEDIAIIQLEVINMAKSKLPTTMNEASMPSKINEAEERRWKAEDALRDIERAEKHKSDKLLMKDVKACAKEKMKALSKVTGK